MILDMTISCGAMTLLGWLGVRISWYGGWNKEPG